MIPAKITLKKLTDIIDSLEEFEYKTIGLHCYHPYVNLKGQKELNLALEVYINDVYYTTFNGQGLPEKCIEVTHILDSPESFRAWAYTALLGEAKVYKLRKALQNEV